MSDDFFSHLDTEPTAGNALESLIAADKGEVRTSSKPIEYLERCPSCRGSGVFRGYSGRVVGTCFKCKGTKSVSFKTSPEARKAVATAKVERMATWAEEHMDVMRWCGANSDRSRFASSLLDSFAKYHKLSDGQVAAVRKIIAEDAQKAVQRERDAAEAAATAPKADTAGIDRLKAAFDAAVKFAEAKGKGRGNTIRNPRIVVNGMTLSPAKAHSANPGAIYAKLDDIYLGKVVDGRFLKSYACTAEQANQVLAFIADPKQAAKAYGQETGVCCVCNATLKSEWRLKGIGPICSQKMGW